MLTHCYFMNMKMRIKFLIGFSNDYLLLINKVINKLSYFLHSKMFYSINTEHLQPSHNSS